MIRIVVCPHFSVKITTLFVVVSNNVFLCNSFFAEYMRPVSSIKKNLIYKNAFFAECNGVVDYKTWRRVLTDTRLITQPLHVYYNAIRNTLYTKTVFEPIKGESKWSHMTCRSEGYYAQEECTVFYVDTTHCLAVARKRSFERSINDTTCFRCDKVLLANDQITCGSAALLSSTSVSINLDLLERHVYSQKLAPNIISQRQFCPGGYVSSPVRQNGGTVSVA